ncbi:hypothetical protein WMY93_022625 [Mugilogobius chulae]|uniref:SH3 domain-containing protein n=1 Tax=Mugilogobius chulae TaxID=88201 RepID=A0AAW0N8M7_9GOBI
MEVLVLVDFEGTMPDELSVKMGDVVKNVTKSSEEGWLQGELRGKKGIIPANFVQEVPVNLRGHSKMEPRSVRQSNVPFFACLLIDKKIIKQPRRCEVVYAYAPQNQDELELCVGEVIEIMNEIEDGWWMGIKKGKVGAFPSNFVKEIIVKVECCKVMFDYKPKAEDELELKKGDVVVVLSKETEDDGCQTGSISKPPTRGNTLKHPSKPEVPAMDKNGVAKTKDEKTEPKDLRSNPPTKFKLPSIPPTPPVKPGAKLSLKSNGDTGPPSPKQVDEKEKDQFDGVDIQTDKLSHPTANRVKGPQRRPPTTGQAAGAQENESDKSDAESAHKKSLENKPPELKKPTENTLVSPSKPEQPS